jgi:hypothetical protein
MSLNSKMRNKFNRREETGDDSDIDEELEDEGDGDDGTAGTGTDNESDKERKSHDSVIYLGPNRLMVKRASFGPSYCLTYVFILFPRFAAII